MRRSFKEKCCAAWMAACLLAGGTGTAYAQTAFMPLSEVKEGMEGYARTVIQGTDINTFQVHVLGVMKNKGASGGDLVLVRVSGPVIDKTGGIAQGMSGSPVYINGKLLGAIAYGFPQSDGRLGMVTPISDMLKLWTVDDRGEQPQTPEPSSDLIPVSTPLMAVGYTPDALSYLSDKMKDLHMVPYSAASAGSDDTALPLEPGSSVAATLVTGDLKLGAIGTVTYVDGDHIVAFGHPFMNRGNSDYFMHNSYIFTVVPSREVPFKLGSVGAEIGAVTQDRGTGISGIEGKSAEAVPLHVSVSDTDTQESSNLNVRMIRSEKLMPTLAATSVYNAVSQTLDRSGQGTVSLKYTLWPENLSEKPFIRENMYWSSEDVAEKGVDELYAVMKLLEQNRFQPYQLRNITVDMSVTQKRNTAQLLDASAAPMIVSPGDPIYIRVRLQPYRGDVFYKEMTFTVPKDQPYGNMVLEIRGGGVIPLPYLIQQQQYNLTEEILDRIRTYKDFSDLRDKLEKEDRNNQIVAEILDPNISLISKENDTGEKAQIQNRQVKPQPGYLKSKEKTSEEAGKEDTVKSCVDTDYVILGDGQFVFQVMKPADRDRQLKKLQKQNKKDGHFMVKMRSQEKDLIPFQKENSKDSGTAGDSPQ